MSIIYTINLSPFNYNVSLAWLVLLGGTGFILIVGSLQFTFDSCKLFHILIVLNWAFPFDGFSTDYKFDIFGYYCCSRLYISLYSALINLILYLSISKFFGCYSSHHYFYPIALQADGYMSSAGWHFFMIKSAFCTVLILIIVIYGLWPLIGIYRSTERLSLDFYNGENCFC